MTLSSPKNNHSSFLRSAILKDLFLTATNSDSKESQSQSQSLTDTVGTKPVTEENILERSFYVFNHATTAWKATKPRPSSNHPGPSHGTDAGPPTEITATGTESTKEVKSAPSMMLAFKLVTWNVDFSKPYQPERLSAILAHIQHAVIDPSSSVPSESTSTSTSTPPPSAQSHLPFLLLQEVHYSCFPALLKSPLVRKSYAASDISPLTWSGPDFPYGTITLIPLTLVPSIHRVFRTPFVSDMGRDALYVDILLGTGDTDGILRIANTHLESLRDESDLIRPVQLESIATCLRANDVRAGIVAGDMNPIGPLDKGLSERVGLSDAWIVHRSKKVDSSLKSTEENRNAGKIDGFSTPIWRRKGKGAAENDNASKTGSFTTPIWRRKGKEAVKNDEDADECDGYTWGVQPRSRFPKERMDRILFTGGVEVDFIERIGIGLKISISHPGTERKDHPWASDHYGLVTHFKCQ